MSDFISTCFFNRYFRAREITCVCLYITYILYIHEIYREVLKYSRTDLKIMIIRRHFSMVSKLIRNVTFII